MQTNCQTVSRGRSKGMMRFTRFGDRTSGRSGQDIVVHRAERRLSRVLSPKEKARSMPLMKLVQ